MPRLPFTFHKPFGRTPSGAPFAVSLLLRKQQLGDLHGVERSALADLVGDNPHGQAVLDRGVAADAADVGVVRASQQARHGIHVVGRVVHDGDARRGGKRLTSGLGRHVADELDVDGLAVQRSTARARRWRPPARPRRP